MAWADSEVPGLVTGDLTKIQTLIKESGAAYATSGDGSTIDLGANGLEGGHLFLHFRVPDKMHDFTLHWPNNQPVELGI